mmetsp:Transcript_40382/g.99178  ORF Transcript_40382/g.99178 Transcript_40382/m.99178 type:complete len:318 (-) Transcript_40382:161-1114(-)
MVVCRRVACAEVDDRDLAPTQHKLPRTLIKLPLSLHLSERGAQHRQTMLLPQPKFKVPLVKDIALARLHNKEDGKRAGGLGRGGGLGLGVEAGGLGEASGDDGDGLVGGAVGGVLAGEGHAAEEEAVHARRLLGQRREGGGDGVDLHLPRDEGGAVAAIVQHVVAAEHPQADRLAHALLPHLVVDLKEAVLELVRGRDGPEVLVEEGVVERDGVHKLVEVADERPALVVHGAREGGRAEANGHHLDARGPHHHQAVCRRPLRAELLELRDLLGGGGRGAAAVLVADGAHDEGARRGRVGQHEQGREAAEGPAGEPPT